jgi:predicted ATPase
LIKYILHSDIKGLGLICSYQEPISKLLKNQNDKFYKVSDLIAPERDIYLHGLMEEREINDLIKFLFNEEQISKIDPDLNKILLKKTFKGTPVFILEVLKSLIEQKLIQTPSYQLIPTSHLDDMDKNEDWISFIVPVRFEKILGNIIDMLNVKEIIILKCAAVIGNIFDLETLFKISPFNNLSYDDLYLLMCKFEVIKFI